MGYYSFNFTPQARVCKRCNTAKHVRMIQTIQGQYQKCTKCNERV